MEILKKHACFGGVQGVYRHPSAETGTAMDFAVYLPPQAEAGGRLPVLYFLSGLTCNWENVTVKAGAQRYAAEHGLILVAPDTSPRGLDLPGEHDSYDFGSGAGFYVDATQAPWASNYRMYSYVTQELPALIAAEFPVDPARQGITGHSMGGHGALVCALRNPQQYRSVSAFSPIVAPSQVPWGQKALGQYLGPDREAWRAYDATA
ncbi:MAG: S-formylglutathione hydrolase, partial [Alphaproteobacteria bacterium]|nr:S-formylglutathione hydrolase [Alphaproteobacteria bacterium]